MWLCYLDESGTADLDDVAQPFYVVTAVCVDENRWHVMRRALESVIASGRRQCLPEILAAVASDEKKCAKWSRKAFASSREVTWATAPSTERDELRDRISDTLEKRFELHTEPLWRGSDCFLGVSQTTRLRILDAALRVLEQHRPQLVSVVLDKAAHKQKYAVPHPCAPWTFNLLVERIEGALHARGAGERGLLVADSGGADGGQITRMMRIFQAGGRSMVIGKTIDRVIDNVYFVESVHSPEVQVADLCGYFVRHRVTNNPKTQVWQQRVAALFADGWQPHGPSRFP